MSAKVVNSIFTGERVTVDGDTLESGGFQNIHREIGDYVSLYGLYIPFRVHTPETMTLLDERGEDPNLWEPTRGDLFYDGLHLTWPAYQTFVDRILDQFIGVVPDARRPTRRIRKRTSGRN